MAFTNIVAGTEPFPGYRLEIKLGEGKFGTVWQTVQAGGVRGAMKISRELNGLYAIREWQSLKAVMNLNHPNLCTLSGVWLKDEHGHVLSDEEIRALLPPPPRPRKPDKPSVKPTDGKTPTAKAPGWNPQAQVPRREGIHLDKTIAIDDVPPHAPETQSGAGTDVDPDGDQGVFSTRKPNEELPPLQLFIAMDKGDGTLTTRVRECFDEGHTGIPRDELINYIEDAADGLQFLNKRGIHHCDVKPENLLLVGGAVKVCDYGSALKTMQAAEEQTQHGYTELYAAPEQMHRKKIVVFKSTDQYALALTYYTLRTNDVPWNTKTGRSTFDIKQSERFEFSALNALAPVKRSGDSHEARALRKALRFDPNERYEEITGFVAALQAGIRQDEEELRLFKIRRRRRMMSATATLFFTLAIGVVIWKWPEIRGWLSTTDNFPDFIVKLDEGRLDDAILHANETLQGDERVPERLLKALRTRLNNIRASAFPHAEQASELVAQLRIIDTSFRLPAVEWQELQNDAVKEVWKPDADGLSDSGRFAGVARLKDLKLAEDDLQGLYESIRDHVLPADATNPKEIVDAAIGLFAAIGSDPESMLVERADAIFRNAIDSGIRALDAYSGSGASPAQSFLDVLDGTERLHSSGLISTRFQSLRQDARVHACAAALLADRSTPEFNQRIDRELQEAPSLSSVNQSRYKLLHATWQLGALPKDDPSFFEGPTTSVITTAIHELTVPWEVKLVDEVLDRAGVLINHASPSLKAAIESAMTSRPSLLLRQIRRELAKGTPDPQAARRLLERKPAPADERQVAALDAWCRVLEGPQENGIEQAIARFMDWGPGASESFPSFAGHLVSGPVNIDNEAREELIKRFAAVKPTDALSAEVLVLIGLLRAQRASHQYMHASPKDLERLREDCLAWQAIRADEVQNKKRIEFNDPTREELMEAIQVEAELESPADRIRDPRYDAGQDGYLIYVRCLAKSRKKQPLSANEADSLASIEIKEAFTQPYRQLHLAEMLHQSVQFALDLPTTGPVELKLYEETDAERDWKLLHRAFVVALANRPEMDSLWQTDICRKYTILGYLRSIENKEVDGKLQFQSSTIAWKALNDENIDDADPSHTPAEIFKAYILVARANACARTNAPDREVVEAVGLALESEFDAFGVPRRFDPASLVEHLPAPIQQIEMWERNGAPKAGDRDLARAWSAFYGAVGVMLEDRMLKPKDVFAELDNDKLSRLRAIHRCFSRARQSESTHLRLQPGSPERFMRWLAGELLALDDLARLLCEEKGMPFEGVMARDLTDENLGFESIDVALRQAMSDVVVQQHPLHFVILTQSAFYKTYEAAGKKRPDERAAAWSDVCNLLQCASQAAEAQQRIARSPWILRFHARLLEVYSSCLLNHSWCFDWGWKKKQRLDAAVEQAKAAIKDYSSLQQLDEEFPGWTFNADDTSAWMCLGSAYEDLACDQKVAARMDDALKVFEKIKSGESTFETQSLKLTANYHLLRIQARILTARMAGQSDKEKEGTSSSPIFVNLSNEFATLIPKLSVKSHADVARSWEIHLTRQKRPRDWASEVQLCRNALASKPAPKYQVSACVNGIEAAIRAELTAELAEFESELAKLVKAGAVRQSDEVVSVLRARMLITRYREKRLSAARASDLATALESEVAKDSPLDSESKCRLLLAVIFPDELPPDKCPYTREECKLLGDKLDELVKLQPQLPDELLARAYAAKGRLSYWEYELAPMAPPAERAAILCDSFVSLWKSLLTTRSAIDKFKSQNEKLQGQDEYLALSDIVCRNYLACASITMTFVRYQELLSGTNRTSPSAVPGVQTAMQQVYSKAIGKPAPGPLSKLLPTLKAEVLTHAGLDLKNPTLSRIRQARVPGNQIKEISEFLEKDQ